MDIPEWLVYPFFSGALSFFLSKNFYSYELSIDNEQDKIVSAILVGLPATALILFLADRIGFESSNEALFHIGNLFSSMLLTGVFTALYMWFAKPSNNKPISTTNIERKLNEVVFKKEEGEMALFMVELKNRVIYAGAISALDYDTKEEDKLLSIVPFKSGIRCLDAGKVSYNTFYTGKVSPPAVSIFLREIVSIREYSENLNVEFGHSTKAAEKAPS